MLKLALLVSVILVGCAAEQETMTAPGSVEGRIRSVGNEPFSRLVLEIHDGTMYGLRLEAADATTAWANQGRWARVWYSGMEIAPSGTVLVVAAIAIIEGR